VIYERALSCFWSHGVYLVFSYSIGFMILK